MDPISQAALGAIAPQSAANKTKRDSLGLLIIGLIGALAGMAPDLDVLIQSSTDPLLQLEYHRQFTHSLIFIPFGAALFALAFWPFFREHDLPADLAHCHSGIWDTGLLDACTTTAPYCYGRSLMHESHGTPFRSSTRFSRFLCCFLLSTQQSKTQQ